MPLDSKYGNAYYTVHIEDNTDRAITNLRQVISDVLHQVGLRAVKIAQGYETAIDTGRLNRSICTWSKDHPAEAVTYSLNTKEESTVTVSTDEENVVYWGTDVEYGIFIEAGSLRHTPLHFLMNSAQPHADEYKEMISNALENAPD